MAVPSRTKQNEVKWTIIGSLCIFMYAILTTLQQVVIKYSELSLVQCAVGRFGIQFVLASLWWTFNKPTKPHLISSLNDANETPIIIHNWYGDAPFIANIWARGILYASNQFIFYVSLILLPIGDNQCILYQSPVLVVYFAAIFLKEPLPACYILLPSTLMTLIGNVLISQPSFLLKWIDSSQQYEPLNPYGLVAAVASAVNWVPIVLLIRKATNAHFLQLELASSSCVCFVTLPFTLLLNSFVLHVDFIGDLNAQNWSFDMSSIGVMLFLGFLGFSQVLFSVVGYQTGAATYVSWLELLTIPIGFLYQALLFEDVPNRYELIGGGLVTAGCVLPFLKELWVYCTLHKHYMAVDVDGHSLSDA